MKNDKSQFVVQTSDFYLSLFICHLTENRWRKPAAQLIASRPSRRLILADTREQSAPRGAAPFASHMLPGRKRDSGAPACRASSTPKSKRDSRSAPPRCRMPQTSGSRRSRLTHSATWGAYVGDR